MTQFALARASAPIAGLVGLDQKNDDFLVEKAQRLFPEADTHHLYVFDVNGQSIEELFIGAQRSLIMHTNFDETQLCRVVGNILPKVDELVFWYADDYADLDEVHDAKQVLYRLKDAVADSMCELYLRYENPK